MNRGIYRLLFVLCLTCLGAIVPPAAAQSERILRYHSDVDVRDDGSMVVRETIRVVSARVQIRHGIYRDFPTRYRDPAGNRYVVDFEFMGATRDGATEYWRIENISNGKRIYLGDTSEFIPSGEHTYTISYATGRQLGFFADHDELFWNVTGNGWVFSIEQASATIRLPERVPADQVTLRGFTGRQGSMDEDLTATRDPDGSFSFVANRPLGPRQGLTALLMWPKGYFTAPTASQKFQYFIRDNLDVVTIGAGLVIVFLYYMIVWALVGRDPARGVIMPLYEPPEGFSPAAMRYLVRMGYDSKTFAAAVLDLAVKGFLQIKEQAGSYTLYRTKSGSSNLSADEDAVATGLLGDRDELWLHNENHVRISAAMAALKARLKTSEQQIYFVTNGKYMIPAVVLSVAFILGAVAIQGAPKLLIVGFMCVWLSVWSFAVAGLIVNAAHLWRAASKGGHLKAGLTGKAIAGTFISIPFVGGEAMGIWFFAMATSVAIVVGFLVTILLHILFHYLLKSPTRAGRAVLDKVEGFKMFLSAVEGDRLNRVFPPDQTPQVFEKFLPYALALDVEQEWAQKFSGVIGGAGQTPGTGSPAYSPAWYSGGAWDGLGAAGFAGSLSGSFSSAISSSASAPGSGSGGGGGGSGGGGGGGGGGGW